MDSGDVKWIVRRRGVEFKKIISKAMLVHKTFHQDRFVQVNQARSAG